jgi:hypothetical protein
MHLGLKFVETMVELMQLQTSLKTTDRFYRPPLERLVYLVATHPFKTIGTQS